MPHNQLLQDCAVVVDCGDIVTVTTHNEAASQYSATETVELAEHLLIPGLVNAHGHGAMSLLRGYADDQPLHTWLNDHIWPAEQQWVSEPFVRDGTNLAMAEMIRSGTTCFADMYFFPEAIAAAASRCGLRAQVAFPVFDFPSNWGSGPDDYIHKGLALRDGYKNDDMIQIAFGPHAPYTVADEALQKVATYSEELATPIHIHLHETAQEVADEQQKTGLRPIERLNQLGVMSPLTQCVHMTQINDTDLTLLHDSGAHVIHCPESNLKLASGFCPVKQLLDRGINVALGTDGAASNNDLSLLGEMKTAALLAKAIADDATALNAHSALRMATLAGARALGMGDRVGSIEAGKAADLTAVRLDELESLPLFNPVSQLVYT
ncbi:MAG: TRZ/ATZ family hydrolase, partial [Porticoccaceae bacterium]|nr:TRZ/ATZ family hydrolase [Porticoccaceae bacterium]